MAEKSTNSGQAQDAASGAKATTQADTQQQSVELDESQAVTSYTNFCRVTGAPEELLIDFGLNSQPLGNSGQPVWVNQRIVMNFYTAKRLLAALHLSIQRHEAVFGVLETDIQRRVQPSAQNPQPPAN